MLFVLITVLYQILLLSVSHVDLLSHELSLWWKQASASRSRATRAGTHRFVFAPTTNGGRFALPCVIALLFYSVVFASVDDCVVGSSRRSWSHAVQLDDGARKRNDINSAHGAYQVSILNFFFKVQK